MAASKIAQCWHTFQGEPIDLSFREASTIADLLDDIEQSHAFHSTTTSTALPPSTINSNLTNPISPTKNTGGPSSYDVTSSPSTNTNEYNNGTNQKRLTSPSTSTTPPPPPPSSSSSSFPNNVKSSVANSTIFSNTTNNNVPAKHVSGIKEEHSALKLSNNHLSQLTSFPILLQKLHLLIDQLKWLDLSFNQFTTIDPALHACTGLTHLYLHANQIEKITVLEKLATFPFSQQLKSFAIHGNPVAQHKDCKRCVLLACPKLKHFDFCGVTKGDRSTAKYTSVGTKEHGAGLAKP